MTQCYPGLPGECYADGVAGLVTWASRAISRKVRRARSWGQVPHLPA